VLEWLEIEEWLD